ncbi:HAD-superfamily hydrolase, subfamily IA, variant 1 [Gemmatirosa kalamazoonensis]|uniref:HAD-superfamily hydrolase, subfamily IA, variant 1 n=1 Tax=Gemmatirosa kalamazoonensis TaxID=861299 RepID=W0RCL5_9BACT|nr:HAD family hydrolase [Gemmatirosa kalamazoonensis]AHG88536.1 HAD-superfamily hydrolase, subfamily IA, variant 1 [Gemmatirosa kalamazoonensis]
MSVAAVFFDVGETLVDESRLWRLWADWLGVPRDAFLDALYAVIARGEHHRRVFDVVRPDLAPFDVDAARRVRAAAGWPEDRFTADDVYPDAVPSLRALAERGYVVGIAGNQPAWTEAMLRGLDARIDVVASSERWGVEKPSPAFFAHLAGSVALPPSAIVYVGDRLDNDVLPALDAGMAGILLRRGPWGTAHALHPDAARATAIIDGLAELPNLVGRL